LSIGIKIGGKSQIEQMTDDLEKLAERIRELTEWRRVDKPRIVTDTSDPFGIRRGDILRLGGKDFVVKGHKYESRFGIGDQPKYWVFSAIEMETAQPKIIKVVFHEEFHVHIGVFRIHCFRSPEKETRVLELVRGDQRFMQGYTVTDDHDNRVRIIDQIKGLSLFEYIFDIDKPHQQYFAEDLPQILRNLAECVRAIELLHRHQICHGDIRNDHIIIETGTGLYRWIDFDLDQHVSDYDVWSLGNILNYATGRGIVTFDKVLRGNQFDSKIKESLEPADASGFYEYRIMNLKKVYPYIPEKLNNILLHFILRPRSYYATVTEFLEDYLEMLDSDFPTG